MSFEGNRPVAIIGGGLAGLACAHALKRRGVEPVVYESSSRAGGRSDAGVPYLLGREPFQNTFRLIDELGLSSAVVPISPYAGQAYRGKIYRHRVASATGLLRFKGLNLADKALLPRMAYLLARHSSALDFHHPERGLSLDDETVASFIKRELSQNILNQVAGPLISTLFFYGSEETSRLLYLLLAKHMYNTEMSTIRGLAERLSRGTNIVYQRAGPINADRDGYLIDGTRFSQRCSGCKWRCRFKNSRTGRLAVRGRPRILQRLPLRKSCECSGPDCRTCRWNVLRRVDSKNREDEGIDDFIHRLHRSVSRFFG